MSLAWLFPLLGYIAVIICGLTHDPSHHPGRIDD